MESCPGARVFHSSGATMVTSGALRLRGDGRTAENGLGVRSESGIGTEVESGAKFAPAAPITSRRPPFETNRETAARSALEPRSVGSAKISVVPARPRAVRWAEIPSARRGSRIVVAAKTPPSRPASRWNRSREFRRPVARRGPQEICQPEQHEHDGHGSDYELAIACVEERRHSRASNCFFASSQSSSDAD